MVWDENKEIHNQKLTKSDRVEGKNSYNVSHNYKEKHNG